MFSIPSARFALPNLFTLSAALCGVAILHAAIARVPSAQEVQLACSLLPLACLLDGLDGRVARWLHAESDFGVQLDSLSDLATFGVAPAALAWAWALHDAGLPGFLAAALFILAAMTRLARFNVQATEHDKPARWFTGLPVPMAAMAAGAAMAYQARTAGQPQPLAIASVLVACALLMVSNVPFRTFKEFRIRPRALDRLVFTGFLAALALAMVQWGIMAVLGPLLLVYLVVNIAAAALQAPRLRLPLAAAHPGIPGADEVNDLELDLNLDLDRDHPADAFVDALQEALDDADDDADEVPVRFHI
jgi:CDP-diacylglycerol--serine O-phosphatidyltransferase